MEYICWFYSLWGRRGINRHESDTNEDKCETIHSCSLEMKLQDVWWRDVGHLIHVTLIEKRIKAEQACLNISIYNSWNPSVADGSSSLALSSSSYIKLIVMNLRSGSVASWDLHRSSRVAGPRPVFNHISISSFCPSFPSFYLIPDKQVLKLHTSRLRGYESFLHRCVLVLSCVCAHAPALICGSCSEQRGTIDFMTSHII